MEGFWLCKRFTAPLLSASAMRTPVFFFLFLLTASCALAVEQLQGPGSLPIEINATGRTTYENGLATAHDNVAIHFGDTDIYSDFAQYNTAKHTFCCEAMSASIATSRFTSGTKQPTTSIPKRSQPATCEPAPTLISCRDRP